MMSRTRFLLTVLLALAFLVAGCSLPTTSVPTPTAGPTVAPPTAAPPTAQPQPPTATPAQNTSGACMLTATASVKAYTRPSAQAQVFGTLSSGTQVQAQYRTPDGWYGFEPGVAQAGNVGIFRMRWVYGGKDIQMSGNCGQLPLAPPLPAGVCFFMAMDTTPVYTLQGQNLQQIGSLAANQYAAVMGRGPGDWVELNLDSGQNNLHGQGWASLATGGFNGPCDNLPQVQASFPGAATPTPAPTSPPTPQSNETRIQFAAGAITWQAPITGNGNFVFNAMQGQSAEILVLQGGQPADAALAMAAPNGQPLQTYNIGRPDWRGVLPQSGDYHLSIAAPHGLAGMTLRVTIYPLPREPKPVTDTGVGFTLTYDGRYFHPQKPGVFPNEVFGLNLAYKDFFMNTNLQEAFFVMGLESINNADSCLNTPPEGIAIQSAVGTWRVNGVNYRYYIGDEGAAGNFYHADIFRTYIHSRCITVYLYTHTTNINNYTPGSVTPYDKKGVLAQFKRVFFTLQWP